jgi:hypothetical protein
MKKRILEWFRKSPHVHLRIQGVETVRDLVDLIDRFIDNKLKYELEWDDFISWKHENPNIEAIRNRISETEALFFSQEKSERQRAVGLLIKERNRAAAIIEMSARLTI